MAKIIRKSVAVISMLAVIVSVFSVSGNAAFGKPVFDVTLDEQTKEICDLIKENSYLDLEKTVTNFPDLSLPSKIYRAVFFLDNGLFSSAMYSLRDRCYAEGEITLGKICYLIGAYFKGFEKCEVRFEEQDGGIYEFMLYVTYADGEVTPIHSGAYYNPETGLFYGKEDKGISEIGYNLDINEMVVYATVNGWMREFGFCAGYDLFSYTTPFFFYHTRRFKFTYGGKQWMIQAWKGMYVMANGAEVGVYNRNPSIGTYYNCVDDEDMLKISLDLYHGDELLFSVKEDYYWWANGFQLSKTLYNANELTMKFRIEMKDADMLRAFTKSVDRNIFRDVSYTVDGLTVSLVW